MEGALATLKNARSLAAEGNYSVAAAYMEAVLAQVDQAIHQSSSKADWQRVKMDLQNEYQLLQDLESELATFEALPAAGAGGLPKSSSNTRTTSSLNNDSTKKGRGKSPAEAAPK